MTRAFVNWSGQHRVTPRRWLSPETEDELAMGLRGISLAGGRAKAVGSGHSWSDAAVPSDVGVELSRLRGVVAIDDGGSPSITIRAGTRLEEITAALDARGLAMPILGSIAKQTIAGAIATGTHGSSLRYGNLASLVTALRLVTAQGEVLDLVEGDPRLAAARVHLGALGVVSQVTLRVTRAFTLAEEREPMPIGRVIEELDVIAGSAEYVKLWWLPSTGKVVVFRYHRTDERPRHSQLWSFVDEKVVNRAVFEGALRLVGRFPRATGALNGAVASTYLRPGRRVARSDRAFNLAMPPNHREAEWAFGMASAPRALAELADTIERSRLRVNFPCEIRFVQRDDAWLSPAYERDACHIGIYQAESPDLAAYFAAGARIAARHDARPHWGKELPWGREELAPRYPKLAAFTQLAETLDPVGIFENDFTIRVLGARRAGRS